MRRTGLLDRLDLLLSTCPIYLAGYNSRIPILPGHHHNNLFSQLWPRCKRRIQQDWPDQLCYRLLLLGTLEGPDRFHGTIYRMFNLIPVGST